MSYRIPSIRKRTWVRSGYGWKCTSEARIFKLWNRIVLTSLMIGALFETSRTSSTSSSSRAMPAMSPSSATSARASSTPSALWR